MIHTIGWPKDCSYSDLINNYSSYVMDNYGEECLVCFNGYDDRSQSTKFGEQCRHKTNKHISPNIVFDIGMPVTSNQQSFLVNTKNKARLISVLITSFTHTGIACRQSEGDVYFLIANSAITLAEDSDRSVVLVGKDTDLCNTS